MASVIPFSFPTRRIGKSSLFGTPSIKCRRADVVTRTDGALFRPASRIGSTCIGEAALVGWSHQESALAWSLIGDVLAQGAGLIAPAVDTEVHAESGAKRKAQQCSAKAEDIAKCAY